MPRQTNTIKSSTTTNSSNMNINSLQNSISNQSTTSTLDTQSISIPIQEFVALMNSERNKATGKEPIFSLGTFLTSIGIVAIVIIAYAMFLSDIKELKEKISALEKTNNYEQTNKEITNLKNTLNILQTDLSRYNFKTMNDTLLKLEIDMSYIKNNSNQKNSKN